MSPILDSIGSVKGFGWGGFSLVPNSFESIQTVTLSADQSVISFNSIPTTYKHLQLRYMARSTRETFSADNVLMQFNGNTSGYSRHILAGDGTNAFSGGSADVTHMWLGQISSTVTANIFGVGIIDILDYTDTNKFTTIRSLYGVDLNGINNTVSGGVGMWSGLYRNTAVVSTIQLSCQSTGYAAGTRFALYGIKG